MRTSLRLFGTPLIHQVDTPVRFENRKVIALLAYLAVHSQPQGRDKLAALLWPETDQALAALRTTLWELRKKLDVSFLVIARQDIELEPHPNFWCDVHEYRRLTAERQHAAAEPMQQIERIQHAVDLYHDDFMAGFSLRDSPEFDDWLSAQTAYFQRQQQHLLAELVERYRSVHDLYSAILTAERLRAMDRLAEEPVALLMRLYAQTGQAASVPRLFDEYRQHLAAEMRLTPSAELQALYDELMLPTVQRRAAPVPGEIGQPSRSGDRPVTGALVAGTSSAVIYRTAEAVIGRPRRLIGRAEQAAQALTLLRSGERVLLAGMGGIGKTALAAAVSADFIEATRQPAIWLEAGFQSARELFVALARPFGRHQALLGQDDPAPLIMDLLIQHPGLLVIDDTWNASALFELLIAVPQAMPVLITSRQRIPIEGDIITVDRLMPEDARALLIFHAGRSVAPGSAIDSLLSMLGCHPYALEIAGKQLKVQPGLSVSDLMARYARGTREIAVPSGYGSIERQSIEHVIRMSVETVSDTARAILTSAGGLASARAALELIALALDVPLATLDAPFAELEAASLIEIDYQRSVSQYRMHDLVYSFCRDRFRQQGGDRTRIIQAALAFLNRHSSDVLAVEGEFTTLMGAVRAALHHEDGRSAISLVRAIMVDGYFDARGYTPELLDHLDTVIGLAERAGVDAEGDLHYLLCKRAKLCMMREDPARAFEDYVRALAVAPTLQRRALIAFQVANSAYRLGRAEYETYLNSAEQVARDHAFLDVLSRIIEFRGYMAYDAGKLDESREYHREALRTASQLNLPDRTFFALYNLAIAELDMGDVAAAEAALERARTVAEQEQNDSWKALCFSAMGRCTNARGDRVETARLMGEALSIYMRIGDRRLQDWVTQFLTENDYQFEH